MTNSIEGASYRAFDGSGGSLKLASDLDWEPVRVVAAMALADVMRLTSTPSFFSMSATAGLSIRPSKGLLWGALWRAGQDHGAILLEENDEWDVQRRCM